jgi:hypothetical protein
MTFLQSRRGRYFYRGMYYKTFLVVINNAPGTVVHFHHMACYDSVIDNARVVIYDRNMFITYEHITIVNDDSSVINK